jgi:hypothetical protein
LETLYRIFGPPHELLHVLALLLVGRRPKAVGYKHVDIPDDLSTRAYVFVAGLPALVFWGAALISAIKLATATSVGELILTFAVFSVAALAGLGTLGDIQLIFKRLQS